MAKKVSNLGEHRRKKRSRSIEATAKAAVAHYCNPEFLDSIDEPVGLASGKTTASGGFVHDDESDDKEAH